MNICIAITKKGERCRNKEVENNRCRLHMKVADQPTIFNPYYNEMVEVYGDQNCGGDRKSLKRIDNPNVKLVNKYCDVLPLKDINYIIGPVEYDEFKYGKYNIAIFGELHLINIDSVSKLPKNHTLSFTGFLASLLTQNNDKQYDLFVELPYKNRLINPPTTYHINTTLNLIELDFAKCLALVKNCPYKNLRAHYIDYRNVHNANNRRFLHLYRDLRRGIPDLDVLYEFTQNITEIYADGEKVVYTALNDSKMCKQLLDNPLREQIIIFIEQSIKDNGKKFKDFLKANDKYIKKNYLISPITQDALVIIERILLYYVILFAP